MTQITGQQNNGFTKNVLIDTKISLIVVNNTHLNDSIIHSSTWKQKLKHSLCLALSWWHTGAIIIITNKTKNYGETNECCPFASFNRISRSDNWCNYSAWVIVPVLTVDSGWQESSVLASHKQLKIMYTYIYIKIVNKINTRPPLMAYGRYYYYYKQKEELWRDK